MAGTHPGGGVVCVYLDVVLAGGSVGGGFMLLPTPGPHLPLALTPATPSS